MRSNINPQALELADNLVRLTKGFVSTDPGQSANIKLAFKTKSKNDTVRTVAYLLEVVGSKDFECKQLQQENTDLKELLKLNGISLEEPANEKTEEAAASNVQSVAGTPESASVGSPETVATNGLSSDSVAPGA